MTEGISRFTDFGEAWFMLDLPEMKHFIQEYANYAVKHSRVRCGCETRLSVDDFFHIWKQRQKDSGPCRECRIG